MPLPKAQAACQQWLGHKLGLLVRQHVSRANTTNKPRDVGLNLNRIKSFRPLDELVLAIAQDTLSICFKKEHC